MAILAVGCTKKEAPTSTATPSSTHAAEEKPPFKELSLDEVEKRVNAKDGKTFVFDANPEEVFQKHHVPGAVYVPDEGVTASLLPADKNAALIFYCSNTH
jgi:rhodanese-related sulfurtransferase